MLHPTQNAAKLPEVSEKVRDRTRMKDEGYPLFTAQNAATSVARNDSCPVTFMSLFWITPIRFLQPFVLTSSERRLVGGVDSKADLGSGINVVMAWWKALPVDRSFSCPLRPRRHWRQPFLSALTIIGVVVTDLEAILESLLFQSFFGLSAFGSSGGSLFPNQISMCPAVSAFASRGMNCTFTGCFKISSIAFAAANAASRSSSL